MSIYYHGGVGYAFPENWDVELGIGYTEWTHDDQNYSVMPVMMTGTYHFLPRRSRLDIYSGMGLGYAWRNWGADGEHNTPCGQAYLGTNLALSPMMGIGVSGGYFVSDLNNIDEGGFGVGLNLGVGVPF